MFAGPDFGPTGKIAYAAITYALMLVSYTVINVPYSAMLGVKIQLGFVNRRSSLLFHMAEPE
jgi:hypothetical protein